MGASHHSPEDQRRQEEFMRRFIEQAEGKARRRYSAGRIAPDDDGDLAMAIAADTEKGRVVINFGKPVKWFAMTPKEATELAQMFLDKARQISTEPLSVKL